MQGLIQQLAGCAPVVLDGAWGTQLQARGLGLGEFPDFWNLTRPDCVRAVARDYVEAGSRIVLTNTFGASPIRLGADGLGPKAGEINRRGVELSREAAQGRALVFASIGPTGVLLMEGSVEPAQVREAFSEQAAALAAAGADAIVIETMSDMTEAELAVTAARETGLPVVACMVFDSGRYSDCTMMGVTPEQAAEALTVAGADVIGANCGQGIAGFVGICRRLHAATDRPIWIKANAGLPQVEDGRVRYAMQPENFAAYLPELVEAGATFIGGCCGTDPEFIRTLQQVASRQRQTL